MTSFLLSAGYPAIFVLCIISAMCIPVGSELAVIAGGALASNALIHGAHHHLEIVLVIVVAVVGEIIGSLIGYSIGRYGGRTLVDKVGKYILLTHRDLDRAEAWFARRGEPLVLVGRFIPLLRSFVSIAAGLGEMALAKFIAFTVIGCAIWCTALALLGDSLGSTYNHVVKEFSDVGYVFAALAVIVIALAFAHRIRVRRAESAAS